MYALSICTHVLEIISDTKAIEDLQWTVGIKDKNKYTKTQQNAGMLNILK